MVQRDFVPSASVDRATTSTAKHSTSVMQLCCSSVSCAPAKHANVSEITYTIKAMA